MYLFESPILGSCRNALIHCSNTGTTSAAQCHGYHNLCPIPMKPIDHALTEPISSNHAAKRLSMQLHNAFFIES